MMAPGVTKLFQSVSLRIRSRDLDRLSFHPLFCIVLCAAGALAYFIRMSAHLEECRRFLQKKEKLRQAGLDRRFGQA
jgi:hypothetical protein